MVNFRAPMRRAFLFTAVASTTFQAQSCGKNLENQNTASLQTDLGTDNPRLGRVFERYKQKAGGCGKTASGNKRALITGFGRFSGSSVNISGSVVRYMASPQYLTSTITTSESASEAVTGVTPANSQVPSKAIEFSYVTSADFGGTATVRTLTIDGEPYDVCFIVAAVQWDLAAAIMMHEIQRFEPSFVMMTGLNGADATSATFEGGAVNNATEYHGFLSNGDALEANTPISERVIVPGSKKAADGSSVVVGESIAMTWNTDALGAATERHIRRTNPSLKINKLKAARRGNDYICNNVSFVVLHGLKGIDLTLAKDQIKIPGKKIQAKAGFFHYPRDARSTEGELKNWAKVIAASIKSEAR